MSGKLFLSLINGLLLTVAGVGWLMQHATWQAALLGLSGLVWLSMAFKYRRTPKANRPQGQKRPADAMSHQASE
jgi:hypothetical protein